MAKNYTIWAEIVAQSISTHYSRFENMGRFATLEKNRIQNMGWKKQGAKNQGHCYSKREEARLPILFLNKNDPVFWHSVFFGPDFFKVPDPKNYQVHLIN